MKEFLNFAKTFHLLWSDILELIDENGTLDAIIEYLEANQQPISSTNYKLINKPFTDKRATYKYSNQQKKL
ncbi:hypothetical protein [Cellulophaga baltica]|uniref:hypothetical protein n=1 Tax=Cellulophaga baltica TaxID=76594 RepID=UPI0003F617DC|nr:hypothetical protein [Cellulophaga baltica]